MIKNLLKLFILSVVCNQAFGEIESYAIVSPRVYFIIHRNNELPILLNDLVAEKALVEKACPSAAKISWVVHGWGEGYLTRTEWIRPVVASTLKAAGGCVIVMDYSFYSGYGKAYSEIVDRYAWLRDTLINAMKMFGCYDRMHCFGFSFGARLCQGAGVGLTLQSGGAIVFGKMDLCDPAGPEFDGYARMVLAKLAAKNVACIHTSNDLGTKLYDCHQNFRMGHCGKSQDGSGDPPKRSHGMCPYMYNYAFTINYTYNSFYENECTGTLRTVSATCKQNMIMGYRNQMFCIGDVNIPTAKCAPFLYNGTINNYPKGTTTCPPY